jgi:hypothetical protein
LEALPQNAEVHSVFHHSFNWIDHEGNLITVANKGFGNLPCGILVDLRPDVDFPSLGIFAGQRIQACKERMRLVENDLIIDFNHSEIWPARSYLIKQLASLNILSMNTDTASAIAAGGNRTDGFAPLLGSYHEILNGNPIKDPSWTPLCRCAVDPIILLVNGIRSFDASAIEASVYQLVGLGIGLTPSGDDVLTGALGTLALLGEPLKINPWIETTFDGIARIIGGRSTLIGETYLRYALKGIVTEILGTFVVAVATEGADSVSRATKRLIAFGYSSGQEIALGSLLALKLAIEKMQTT